MRASVDVNTLHQRFRDRVDFLFVYIREAHPTDGWVIDGSAYELKDPETAEQRHEAARKCLASVEFDFPTVVDGLDDAVNVAWAAWPERLYLVDTAGIIRYAGLQGPWGFSPLRSGGEEWTVNPLTETKPSLEAFLEEFLEGRSGAIQ